MRRAFLIVLVATLVQGCSALGPRSMSSGPAVTAEGAVRFRFFAPNARWVQLAGDWPENNWGRGDGIAGEARIGLMDDPNGDGVWEITIELAPGRYKYVFWVDEVSWHIDPGNPEEVPGGPGRVASQLVLERKDNSVVIR